MAKRSWCIECYTYELYRESCINKCWEPCYWKKMSMGLFCRAILEKTGHNLEECFMQKDSTNIQIKESNMTLNVAELEGGVIWGSTSIQVSMDRSQITGNSARCRRCIGSVEIVNCKYQIQS